MCRGHGGSSCGRSPSGGQSGTCPGRQARRNGGAPESAREERGSRAGASGKPAGTAWMGGKGSAGQRDLRVMAAWFARGGDSCNQDGSEVGREDGGPGTTGGPLGSPLQGNRPNSPLPQRSWQLLRSKSPHGDLNPDLAPPPPAPRMLPSAAPAQFPQSVKLSSRNCLSVGAVAFYPRNTTCGPSHWCFGGKPCFKQAVV